MKLLNTRRTRFIAMCFSVRSSSGSSFAVWIFVSWLVGTAKFGVYVCALSLSIIVYCFCFCFSSCIDWLTVGKMLFYARIQYEYITLRVSIPFLFHPSELTNVIL